jgi:uncharacterized protein (DUF983 family)
MTDLATSERHALIADVRPEVGNKCPMCFRHHNEHGYLPSRPTPFLTVMKKCKACKEKYGN